jgi:myo-inositol catabolism protein IolS
MKYRTLGKTGWDVSVVSMGCWGIGGQWGPVEEKDAIAAIETARENGVNLFDTADAYGMGRSEEIVGKVLGKRPDDIYVATKVGNWGRRFDDVLPYNSVHSIYESCHASLYRLKTEVIDLYQCHIQKPDHPDVFLEAFEELKKQGKIREYAISTDNLDGLKAMNANNGCASCQIRYSMLDRSAERELFPYCLEHSIGVLLRGPIAMGVLTGKFNSETTFDDSIRSAWNEGEAHAKFLRRVETAEKLKKLVRDDRSLLDIALQFPLTQPAVTCSIPGMKNAEQARANTAAINGELSHQDLAMISSICPPGIDL